MQASVCTQNVSPHHELVRTAPHRKMRPANTRSASELRAVVGRPCVGTLNCWHIHFHTQPSFSKLLVCLFNAGRHAKGTGAFQYARKQKKQRRVCSDFTCMHSSMPGQRRQWGVPHGVPHAYTELRAVGATRRIRRKSQKGRCVAFCVCGLVCIRRSGIGVRVYIHSTLTRSSQLQNSSIFRMSSGCCQTSSSTLVSPCNGPP